ncbi:hypothetical protein EIP86_001252 [Pleurotus ostreatoroseus]|nr:hypothetical protein EIP86_001252 [Pleurotus ostreatoroseus]
MCTNWDPDELKAGRRLVRFIRSQEGYKVKLSCECIKQDDYVEGDTVISCIHRRDTDTCYVTSVDIIFLLESIVGEEFEIEEKNRIRRNLEGFRPKTISKNRVGSESFFQQIMDFPAPKPRNIEKDVKVFEWNVLPQALEKIISKYSLYYSLDGSDRSTPGTASPNDVVTFKSSPESIPTFSPSTSASDIPEHPDGGDQFLYAADSFESGQTGAFNSRGEIPQAIPFLARTEAIGSYGSTDTPSMMTSSSGNPEGGALAYQPVYRLMPSTQAFPMSDTPVAASNIMSGEEYHSFEDRIRSPVSYF